LCDAGYVLQQFHNRPLRLHFVTLLYHNAQDPARGAPKLTKLLWLWTSGRCTPTRHDPHAALDWPAAPSAVDVASCATSSSSKDSSSPWPSFQSVKTSMVEDRGLPTSCFPSKPNKEYGTPATHTTSNWEELQGIRTSFALLSCCVWPLQCSKAFIQQR
jgi:hypothetical protein